MRIEPVDHRYAQALLGAALSKKEEGRVGEDLQAIQGLFAGDVAFFRFLDSPQVLTEYKIEILGNVLRDRVGRLTLEFLKLLIRKGRIGRLPSMVTIYLRLLEEHQGILEAEVTTAVPLDDARSRRLQAALERLTKKKILLRPSVDPTILGGVVVHYGDTTVDGSVERKIRDLREDLGRLRVH